ncbi:uncharacterized protein LOC110275071 [Arachis duranensis]|uniref:Uncharacterized protein LOC110275071 n=1 Tax=Arachis duranensis TaxID=130453 RepID=A0A6P5MP10_ARADU|nr:uncharacterized protein LOC110275071 [Arachis duranensis]
MADDSHEDGHTASDSEQEKQDVGNHDADIITHQGVTNQHREGTSGLKDPKANSSEGHESGKEGQSRATDSIGLFHGHQGRLEQLEQELKRQREAERNLRNKIERRKELVENILRLESTIKSRSSRSDQEYSLLGREDPFSEDIISEKVPRNFKSLDMDLYDGTTDPKHHLSNFKIRMYLADASDATHCKAFPTTLTKVVMKWFDSLPPRVAYQRLMNKVFSPHLGNLMKVYVDNMLVKTKDEADVLADLSQVFNTIRMHRMRLNPAKCIFAVETGKFLGFMLTERGIEANPDKCKAVLEMKSSHCLREVQQLNGRLVALSRFLAGSALRSLPLFSLLRKECQFEWTPECEEAFQEFKKFLSQPPILTRPKIGEELVLYFFVADKAVASALIREDEVG